MLYHSTDNDLVGIWCFDLERALIHIVLFYLAVMASQAIWHLCLPTWGSPTARSIYFNQGFLYRPRTQLGLSISFSFLLLISDHFLSFYYFTEVYKESRQKSNHSVGRLVHCFWIAIIYLAWFQLTTTTKLSVCGILLLLSYLFFWTQKYLVYKKVQEEGLIFGFFL